MNQPKLFSTYSIRNIANSDVYDILIYEDIGETFDWATWTVKGVTYQKFESEFNNVINTASRINVRINSVGGDVHMGLSIYNLIARNNSKNIHIYVDGVAYSMAAIITQAVNKDKIHIANNGMLMFHSATGFIQGYFNSTGLREMADVLEKYDEILANSLSYNLGISLEEFKAQYFDGKDHYFTPQEALDAGLVHDIVESHSDNAPTPTASNPAPISNSLLDNLEKMVSNLKNKFQNKFQTINTHTMTLDEVKHKLETGAVTDEEAKDLANVIAKFNTSKITDEELSQAVATAEQAKDDIISQKDTEIEELKAKLANAVITNGGGNPAGGNDNPIDKTPAPTNLQFIPVKIFK